MDALPPASISRPPKTGNVPVGWARLRPAALIHLDEWAAAHTEQRQLLRAHAVQRLARGTLTFSHITACPPHSLPLVGVSDARVHTTSAVPNPPKTRGDVVRHKLALPDDETVRLDGLRVTSLERTVADVIRMLPPAAGLAVLDAALRQVAWDDDAHVIRAYDDGQFRSSVSRRIAAAAGGRGVRNARLVLELGDGRAQLPGESVSRFRFWELNLPLPELQVRVVTRIGVVFLDVAWPSLRCFGEFDGAVKLHDPRYTKGRTADEIRASQAERRAAVEEATGWSSIHWGWKDAQDASDLWRLMLEQGFPARARLSGGGATP